jgi:capsular polysaccharide transport system permease protein
MTHVKMEKALAPGNPSTLAAALPRIAHPARALPQPAALTTEPLIFRPAARPGRLRRRHVGLFLSFFLMVVGPALVSGWYLWVRAADQYASTVGFSVRKEEVSSAVELLGGITALSGSSSADTDILYEYIYSPRLVAEIDAALDLRAIWSRAAGDPLFAFTAPGTIEDLADHWRRKVRVSYDSGTHLIEVRVLAFEPGDAQRIAQAILVKSGEMINELNAIAREDTIRYAREDLDKAAVQLKAARVALTGFRNRTQIVDPTADVQSQTGLLAKLQEQLAEAMIDLDLMVPNMREGDLRLEQARARVTVTEARIAAERQKLGLGDGAGQGAVFATLVGEFERLSSDLEFAEESYRAARAAHDAALAEARRQGRYLAAHIAPMRAESARFPQRVTLLATLVSFLVLSWAMMALVYYSLRDRR